MTTYGTIPTSSSGGGATASMEYISRAKATIKEGLGTRRAWREMFNFHSFGLPSSFHDAVSRIQINIAYFRMNYALAVLPILFLSLLWHPISLIVFVALMAVWLFLYFLRDFELVIFGRQISDGAVLIVLSVLTIVLLLFTGATWNIITSLLIGALLVVAHGALRTTDDLALDEESSGLLASHAPSVPSS
ncbi:unnamed protein product [Cuscuta campestris]|uniref:PRA1 family protein n=1 Tax=Cuscuta campestris TaxID=132261 RepID=A0A484NGX4_9ASTE|nr:unnamed protein product [Cuscuta campestris]